MERKSSIVLAGALALCVGGVAQSATFNLGFDGCPAAPIEGTEGQVVSIDLFPTLTTADNAGKDGPQGWSLSMQVSGAVVKAVTVKGVKVSTRFDDDGDDPDENGTFDDDQDPGTPEVAATPIVDPFEQDLAQAGFKVAQKATGDYPNSPVPGTLGAVSAIVLHQTQKQVLQPNGKVQIGKLTIEATIPAAEAGQEVVVKFVDALKGQGQPVNNVVTFGGTSNTPIKGECKFTVRKQQAARPEFALTVLPEGETTLPALEGGNAVLQKTVPIGENTFTTFVRLTSANLPGKDGPQGWSISMAHEPCVTVDSVTIKGVKVNTRFDDDGDDPDENGTFDDDQDPGTPEVPATPILENFEQDLATAGFKVAQKATGDYPNSPIPGTAGVVSAIVLHQTQKQVLNPNTTDTILRVVYKINVTEGLNADCKITFVDALKGQGQPVNNVITFAGASNSPSTKQGLVLRLTGEEGPQPGKEDQFIRGDSNNDGRVNIADPVWTVHSVVPGLPNASYPTPCRDAGDSNDDERHDLLDAVYTLNWQFRGGPAPPPPNTCGTDDDATDVSCPEGSTNCPSVPAA